MATLLKFFLCFNVLLVFLSFNPFHALAVDAAMDFEIIITGNKIPDTEIYEGLVTISIVSENKSEYISAFINYNGIWMKLDKRQGDSFTAAFSKDGDYTYQFRLEDTQTKHSAIKQIHFVIDSQLSKLTDEADALPDLNTATDQTVEENQDAIVSVKKKYHQLSEEQRRVFPPYPKHKIITLYNWLQNIRPAVDYREPAPPVVSIDSELPPVRNIYPGMVKISVRPKEYWDFHSIMVNINGNWRPLQKDQDSIYSLMVLEEGKYSISFCTQDQNANISESASVDFTIDPIVYDVVSETERLYNNAQSLSRDDYLISLENTYLQYLYSSPLKQSQIPSDITGRLEDMYTNALSQYGLTNSTDDQEGNFMKAFGMLTRLGVSLDSLLTSQITLKAERVNRITVGRMSTNQNIRAQYDLHFETTSLEDGDVPYKIQSDAPILFHIQVPADLMGRKNVDILYLKDGNYINVNAKVRSTKDGLVLVFSSSYLGDFLFVSD
jgi:hypothetical protein